jgi:hypothetical protein
MSPIECRRNAAGCRQAAKEANTSDNLRRMFLAIAQWWTDAAERLERDMGLKRVARSGLETQTVEHEISPPSSFNHIPASEMLWGTRTGGHHA